MIVEAIGMRLRGFALAALVALAVGAAACGDSGSGDKGSASAQASGDAAQTADERQIHALIGEFGRAMTAADGERACALMVEGYRRQLAALEKAPCPKAFHAITDKGLVEDPSPRIIRTRIGGSEASVVGWVSHLKERQTALFAKVGDEWRLQRWFQGS